jgi:hypothetical protein
MPIMCVHTNLFLTVYPQGCGTVRRTAFYKAGHTEDWFKPMNLHRHKILIHQLCAFLMAYVRRSWHMPLNLLSSV